MKKLLLGLMLLSLSGCAESTQTKNDRFTILRSVTTLAVKDDKVVNLTLPEGCVIEVFAKENKTPDSKTLARR